IHEMEPFVADRGFNQRIAIVSAVAVETVGQFLATRAIAAGHAVVWREGGVPLPGSSVRFDLGDKMGDHLQAGHAGHIFVARAIPTKREPTRVYFELLLAREVIADR